MKLIDKDALVQYLTGMAGCACCDENVERIIRKFIIPHINTLEVKEVDLKKEIENYLSTYWPEKKELHPFLGHIAKHFFKLGMAVSNKAQKGE